MKVTKYEQSCLLLELGTTKILIDPGYQFAETREIAELGKLDAVFVTHEHIDHFDRQLCQSLNDSPGVYVNESTAKQLDNPKNVISDNQIIKIGDFEIKTVELPHCLMPDGSEGPQNTGFLINGMLFHPGDGIELEGLSVKYLALPITGPDVSMKRAFQFARQVSAYKAIAIHYDTFGADANLYSEFAKRFKQPFEVIVLEADESVEI